MIDFTDAEFAVGHSDTGFGIANITRFAVLLFKMGMLRLDGPDCGVFSIARGSNERIDAGLFSRLFNGKVVLRRMQGLV